MKRRWRKIRHQLEWLGLLVFTSILPRLPRWLVVKLAHVLGGLVYHLDHSGRAITLANLTAAFGDDYTPAHRRRIAQASYRSFSRTMFDLLWSPALTPQNFHRYLKVENLVALERLRARGESVVLVSIHQDNFEWAGLAMAFHGINAAIVAEQFKNPRLEHFFKRCREVSGHRIIPQKSSMLRLLKHVRHGGVAGLLADLNRQPTEAATVIDAFGMKMCVTFLHAVLVQRGPAHLVPLTGRSQPDGTCLVTVHEPLTFSPQASRQEIAQGCWDFFAPGIHAQPESWMWNYRHWRFKPRQSARAYPFYAQEHCEFDRLLATARPQPEPPPVALGAG